MFFPFRNTNSRSNCAHLIDIPCLSPLLFRMSWDPNLVSKEVRLLDHTISMYSLVHVCTFCSQFFDPDFPDGIAYPVRVASPVRVPGLVLCVKCEV